eukprot:1193319-Prorocentrum_minimum.AAC.2
MYIRVVEGPPPARQLHRLLASYARVRRRAISLTKAHPTTQHESLEEADVVLDARDERRSTRTAPQAAGVGGGLTGRTSSQPRMLPRADAPNKLPQTNTLPTSVRFMAVYDRQARLKTVRISAQRVEKAKLAGA